MLLFETVMCFRTEQTHKVECEILFHSYIRMDLSGETLAPLINTYRRTIEGLSFIYPMIILNAEVIIIFIHSLITAVLS